MAKNIQQKETKKQTATFDKHSDATAGFAFGKQNYKLLFIGLALILLGFLLMIGGGSDKPEEFSDKIFNFRRLTLAPILVLAGYVVEIFAIMKKPKE
ncbi:MAG: DUF3098 domain-containing protein [Bacteroidales bacterium]|nr:DUF3098 domain-containing protein [Bacteroidales bacterium]